ncbi:hypothetical protein PDL71_15570 [Lacibacter sp. MH-610]|uniref:hypothetical protein n=1 Tax=Lacibacter sp. MH-610 TaxID=3020883 RepID=UPI0038929655
MIHITKAKGGFMVVMLASNKKVLSTSEIFTTKASAHKNVAAQVAVMGDFDTVIGYRDDTTKIPQYWLVGTFQKRKRIKTEEPFPVYKPQRKKTK